MRDAGWPLTMAVGPVLRPCDRPGACGFSGHGTLFTQTRPGVCPVAGSAAAAPLPVSISPIPGRMHQSLAAGRLI